MTEYKLNRSRFERGDRVALEHTDDPHTRLRPGDEGTVTRYDPGLGQFSDCRALCGADELRFCVADMSATLTGRPRRSKSPLLITARRVRMSTGTARTPITGE